MRGGSADATGGSEYRAWQRLVVVTMTLAVVASGVAAGGTALQQDASAAAGNTPAPGPATSAAGNMPADGPVGTPAEAESAERPNGVPATESKKNRDTTAPGQQLWNYTTGGPVRSSPTIVDDTVFVGSDDHQLYALAAERGTETWAYTMGDGDPSFEFSSPTVANGTVYIGSAANELQAVDAATGIEQWTQPTERGIQLSPTVANGTLYGGSAGLRALDAATGTNEWYSPTRLGFSSPTVANGTVYVGSREERSRLVALDAETGAKQWEFAVNGPIHSSPTVAGGTVYAGSGDGQLYALDAETGTEQWRVTVDGPQFSSPTVADGTVYVGAGERLYALDAETGTEQWRHVIESALISSPTVAGNTIYVGTGFAPEENSNGELYALDAGTGAKQWAYPTDGPVTSSPTVADGIVYVGADDGKVYAITTAHNESSSGSRVRRGTLGHVGDRAERRTTADTHRITIESPDDRVREYWLNVEGDLTKSTAGGASVDSGDTVDGTTAVGAVGGGRDSYTYTGSLERFNAQNVTVSIDGREVDPASRVEAHTITIESPDDSTREYWLDSTGQLDKSDALDASTNPGDTVDSTTASGAVGGGRDSYTYRGSLDRFNGEHVTVYVDGREVDPSALVTEHSLTIESPDDSVREYWLDVEGKLAKSDALDASTNPGDTVQGTTAFGSAGGGRDSYTYTGRLDQFNAENVTVYLDGKAITPAEIVETHSITVESPDDRVREYWFDVGENLEKSEALWASTNPGDTVDGTTAFGTAGGGRDSYAYTGGLDQFSAENVTVYVDGREVDPAELVTEHTITIESADDSLSRYRLTVDETLDKSAALGASVNPGDTINGTTATGAVGGGRDSYTYTASLDGLTADNVTVRIDGRERAPG